MRISDWSSDVCSSDLLAFAVQPPILGNGLTGPGGSKDFAKRGDRRGKIQDERRTPGGRHRDGDRVGRYHRALASLVGHHRPRRGHCEADHASFGRYHDILSDRTRMRDVTRDATSDIKLARPANGDFRSEEHTSELPTL